jgi:hypothetical protein
MGVSWASADMAAKTLGGNCFQVEIKFHRNSVAFCLLRHRLTDDETFYASFWNFILRRDFLRLRYRSKTGFPKKFAGDFRRKIADAK